MKIIKYIFATLYFYEISFKHGIIDDDNGF